MFSHVNVGLWCLFNVRLAKGVLSLDKFSSLQMLFSVQVSDKSIAKKFTVCDHVRDTFTVWQHGWSLWWRAQNVVLTSLSQQSARHARCIGWGLQESSINHERGETKRWLFTVALSLPLFVSSAKNCYLLLVTSHSFFRSSTFSFCIFIRSS